jgi:serine/threonine-protein kinase PknG
VLTDGERCRATPGCPGTIEDGYCMVCARLQQATAPSSSRTGTSGLRRGSRVTTDARRGGSPLVELPVMPAVDPEAAILREPQVPEHRRFCRCGHPVGRSRDGQPGLLEGFCPMDGEPFSFRPALGAGALVAGQYRVAGCLAHGGLGWIYLARDQRVEGRWVVLKGLLQAGDPDAMAAAVAERQFLARVEHPNVVQIHNVVEHAGSAYIVMQYIGGRTLRTVLLERRDANEGRPDPLPVEHAIAYVLGILPAFAYLHRLGLVYNDFKPDNVMLQDEHVKLIDLGAVMRIDDQHAAIYGTDGYQAPEVAAAGPSVASDLYTIGRCLAVLVMDFRGYQTTHRHSIPEPREQPVLGRWESLDRFLRRGTAADPDERFQSADEMGEQLLGVLREVVAGTHGEPRPAISRHFGADLHAARGAGRAGPDWRDLPMLTVSAGDPAAAVLAAATALGEPERQLAFLEEAAAQGQAPDTIEVQLRLAWALVELGRFADAEARLAEAEARDAWDWRVTWYRGLSLLARGDAAGARGAFDRAWDDLPGELAPRLALAMAAELDGDLPSAARLYDTVCATDPAFTSAAFGLARVRETEGDRAGAVAAYERVPGTSRAHVAAGVAMAGALLRRGAGAAPGTAELVRASAVIEGLALDPEQRARLAAGLLEAALDLLTSGAIAADAGVRLLGCGLEETALRRGLERACRDLANLSPRAERLRLVDRANVVRPVTFL